MRQERHEFDSANGISGVPTGPRGANVQGAKGETKTGGSSSLGTDTGDSLIAQGECGAADGGHLWGHHRGQVGQDAPVCRCRHISKRGSRTSSVTFQVSPQSVIISM